MISKPFPFYRLFEFLRSIQLLLLLSEVSVLNGRVAKIQNKLSDAMKTNTLQAVVSTLSINANEIELEMGKRYIRMNADRFFRWR